MMATDNDYHLWYLQSIPDLEACRVHSRLTTTQTVWSI